VDPVAPPVLADNAYAPYYNPFFGNLAPAAGDPLLLPTSNGSTYSVSKLVVFGDRLADNGNAAALDESLGQAPNFTTAPYSSTGDFSDGAKWTTDLAQILGLTSPSQQQNFAYESATARDLGIPNPFDPNASKTPLDTFAGQIQQFEQQDGSFNSNDLVSITFGGNDISLPSTESPQQGITDSVNAIISGMDQLSGLGAKHFLVSNLADITLAPLFSQPAFLQATGATQAGFQALVNSFNSQLSSALTTFQQQTGADVKTLNLNALFNSIASNPSDFGFTNTTQPILTSTPGTSTPVAYNPAIVGQDPQVQHGSLFLDPYFDPTALGQTIIAQSARSTLTA
jgi:outer membrane lipase/esterase